MRERLGSNDLLRCTHAHFAVALHQNRLRADCQGNLRVVRGQKDCNAGLIQLLQRLQQAVLVAQV